MRTQSQSSCLGYFKVGRFPSVLAVSGVLGVTGAGYAGGVTTPAPTLLLGQAGNIAAHFLKLC